MLGCVCALPVVMVGLFLTWMYDGFESQYGTQSNATNLDPWEGIGLAGYSAFIVAGMCEEVMK